MSLRRTESAFMELAANNRYGHGMHAFMTPQTGINGLILGEVEFDPNRDLPEDILPFSLMEDITGQPQVELVLPQKPISLNMVIDYTEESGDHPTIQEIKSRAIHTIGQAVEHALPSISDRANPYAIGAAPVTETYPAQPISDKTVQERVDRVARMCLQGPTIVISDFRRLPLETARTILPNAIGIKVNHPSELYLPPNVGVIALGKSIEVNTNKSKKLQSFNEELAEKHERTMEQLRSIGMQVIDAIYDPQSETHIDLKILDEKLADAVKSLR